MTTKSALRQEAEAWREIAEQLALGVRFGNSGPGYLCDEVRSRAGYYFCERRIDDALANTMLSRIRVYLDGEFSAFPDDLDIDNALGEYPRQVEALEVRVLICLWFALECEDEARTRTFAKASVPVSGETAP